MSQVYTTNSFSPSWLPGPGKVLDEVTSTNTFLKENAGPVGEWVMALTQREGRGRSNHVWASPRGGLYMSVRVPLCQQILAWSLAMGVAAVEEIRARGLKAALKWPNDVERHGLKLGGILGEVVSGSVVVGLGLNVGAVTLPEGSHYLGGAFDEEALRSWAVGIVGRLSALSNISDTALEARWLGLWHGRESDFAEGPQSIHGVITGVSLSRDEVALKGEGGGKKVRASLLREHWPSLQ